MSCCEPMIRRLKSAPSECDAAERITMNIERCEPELRAFFETRCSDFEDAFQELCVRALHGADTYREGSEDPDARCRAWLYGIARRVVVDFHTGRPRTATLDQIQTRRLHQRAKTASSIVARREVEDYIRDLLKTLPVGQESLLRERFLMDADEATIGEDRGVSVAAVRRQVSKALSSLLRSITCR